ncbi:Gfo/Idh/MocA family oxidoreductase [Campylobacter armoricus]|uniref:Glucosamine-6-P synthase, isomerase subunit PtmF n=1 Tax=Campylobacter armoricus TaxID=2505970 RepID=A0A7L5HYW4_9BACT|nr:Gfo/Idh/MocA family oxidoreductase [Campylobacter armoricus]QKF80156.1 glucosamine-6-P synthase, isomerase subunit PtmF [Campylobacter armoricus]
MKALIIGFGSIGKKHFLALKELGYEVDIVSKTYKQRNFFHISEVNLKEYDLFIIANITTEHFKTLKFIDENVKDKIILVEKPLFEKYKKFIPSLNNQIYIAYLLRFNPLVKDLKSIVQNDQDIYFAKFVCSSYLPNWRNCDYRQNYSAKKELGGGVLLDLSHEIDLTFYFFNHLKLLYSQNLKISELKINSDDFAFLALKAKKKLIHIRLDYFSKFIKREIVFCSKEKSYKADLILNQLFIFDKNGLTEEKKYENDTINTLKNMHKAILKKDENLCTLNEAFKVLKLCDKVKNG